MSNLKHPIPGFAYASLIFYFRNGPYGADTLIDSFYYS
jgi:hypothetical protein